MMRSRYESEVFNLERIEYGIAVNKLIPVYNQSTSKGNQAKYTNGKLWIKLNYLGYEDLAEVFTSELLKYSNLETKEYVEYKLCVLRDEMQGKTFNGCICKQFTQPGESVFTVGRILQKYGVSQKTLDETKDMDKRLDMIVSNVYRETEIDITNYLRKLITLDAIILNEDRHIFNIALIVNEVGEYKLAPIYDNGLSLLSDTHHYGLDIQPNKLIRKIKARPLNKSFKKQVELLGTGFVLKRTQVDELVEKFNDKRIKAVIDNAKESYPQLFV